MRALIVSLVLVILFGPGCASKGPRYASSVQVALYTSETYPPTTELDIFDNLDPLPPHRVLGLLMREGYHRDEGLILTALIWRAKQMGANAIVRLPLRDQDMTYSALRVRDVASAKAEAQQPVWRVHAIRYTRPSQTTSAPQNTVITTSPTTQQP
jgi:hypothetical protein